MMTAAGILVRQRPRPHPPLRFLFKYPPLPRARPPCVAARWRRVHELGRPRDDGWSSTHPREERLSTPPSSWRRCQHRVWGVDSYTDGGIGLQPHLPPQPLPPSALCCVATQRTYHFGGVSGRSHWMHAQEAQHGQHTWMPMRMPMLPIVC